MEKIIAKLLEKNKTTTLSQNEINGLIESFNNEFEDYINNKNAIGLDFSFQSKIAYYTTCLSMLAFDNSQSTVGLILNELLTDIKKLNDKKIINQENLKKNKFLNDNFFIRGNELIVFVKSELGYYLLINNGQLRVFNLTNNANGYHIFADGRFCSGNTYQSLQEVAESKDIYALIMFLIKILTDYDDKEHHLAQPGDFNLWKKMDKMMKDKTIKKQDILQNVLPGYKAKINKIKPYLKELNLSKEGEEYIQDKFASIEDKFRSFII